MAAVGRAFTAHTGTPAIPRGRRVVGVAASLGSGVPPSRRRRDRPVRVFLVGRKADDVLATSAFSTPPAMDDDDDDDAPSTSGRIVLDDAAILRGFDLDPALGAWITARFLFIWTAFGYLSVPTLALLEGVDDVSALRTPHLALALVVAEIGKLGATSLMLRSELAGAASASSAADPWARWRCYPNRASMGADALRGVAFGLAASVAARLTDAAINGVNAEADGGAGGGALALLDTAGDTAGDYSLAVFSLVLSSCAIAPVLEELFFRGFALPACERTVGNAWLSVTCTAGLFAAVHFSVKDAPSLFVAGCFFGLAAVDANGRAGVDANRRDGATGVREDGKDGRVVGLAAPTAAHATFNAGVLLEAMLRSRG